MRRPEYRARRALERGMAALLAVVTIFHTVETVASPADIFSSPAPTISSDPPKATDIKDGDTTVSTQTGAVTYSYPIQVPPGRNGMAPQLSLSYSSQAPLYGSNIGAGWTLNVPRIDEDTSGGRLRTHSPEVESQQVDPKLDDRFTSSLAGGRPLLNSTTDPSAPNVYASYRAQSDASFTRYQRMDATQSFRWRALSTDGTTLYFRSTKGVTPPTNERHRDHVLSKSKGGSGTIDNGQILCRGCNLKKSDKTLPPPKKNDMRKMLFEFETESGPEVESIWVKSLQSNRFEIANIPFYITGIACGDIVEGIEEDHGALRFMRVIESSGHSTIRVIVFDIADVQKISRALEDLGCQGEIADSKTLIAFDIPRATSWKMVISTLERYASAGILDWEEPAISEHHQSQNDQN